MAFDAVEEILAIFPWLSELGEEIYSVLVNGVVENLPAAVIEQNIRETPAYKKRFSGLIRRREAGLPAISEAEYLEVERGYLNQLRNYNLVGTLGFDDREAFQEFAADLIAKDVSVQELNFRFDRAVALMRDSSEFVQQAFEDFYGVQVSPDSLLVYFLDPDRGVDLIEDQVAAAQVGGEAFKFGLNITRTRAEILRKQGVTGELARKGFADVARELPVIRRLARIHQFTPLSQEELENLFFNEDPEVAAQRARTFEQALAEFQEGGAFNINRRGGLGELVDRNRTV